MRIAFCSKTLGRNIKIIFDIFDKSAELFMIYAAYQHKENREKLYYSPGPHVPSMAYINGVLNIE